MDIPCWDELVQYGAMEIIQREYGNYVTETETDYNVSLLIDTETFPGEGGESFVVCTARLWRREGAVLSVPRSLARSLKLTGLYNARPTETRTELIKSFSLLKRNALAAPFERGFEIQKQLEANPPSADTIVEKQELMSIHYR